MDVLNKTEEYVSKTNTKQTIEDQNDHIRIIVKLLLSSIPSGVLLLFLIELILLSTLKSLFSQQLRNG